jgi:polysaccharide pyruvyl transferase WcaK-like protein
MSKRAGKPRRIAIFGHFDGTNLGNESTLQAVLYHLRRTQPDAEVTCICTGPRITAAAHHIRAIPIGRTYVKFWAPRNPLGKVARKICAAIGEPIRWLEGIVALWGTDILIVPGTGLLTDAYGLMGLSWGPYGLLRWSVIAKICGCRLAFVSVGAGPIYGAVGKFFVRSLLSLADFRSYRDESTVRYLQGIGISADRDRVFPDLAFSLPKNAISPRDSTLGAGAVIGLGVMEWADRYSKHPSDAAQVTYLQAFAETARWLLARGYNIRLLIGDFVDARAKQAFLQLLAQHPTVYGRDRIIDEPIHSVEDLLSQIAATDAVVATRFHNILLALLCEKPVVSISFHHKCDSLMAAMGMSDYCLNSGDLEPERLIETFCRLEVNADALKPLIKERIKRFRDALDQQYQLILDGMQSGCWTTSSAAVLVDRIQHLVPEDPAETGRRPSNSPDSNVGFYPVDSSHERFGEHQRQTPQP